MKNFLKLTVILLMILALISEVYYLHNAHFVTISLLWLSLLLKSIESQIKE